MRKTTRGRDERFYAVETCRHGVNAAPLDTAGVNGGRPQGPPTLTYSDPAHQPWLYHGISVGPLDAIVKAKPSGAMRQPGRQGLQNEPDKKTFEKKSWKPFLQHLDDDRPGGDEQEHGLWRLA